jgi:hypothetical protein
MPMATEGMIRIKINAFEGRRRKVINYFCTAATCEIFLTRNGIRLSIEIRNQKHEEVVLINTKEEELEEILYTCDTFATCHMIEKDLR